MEAAVCLSTSLPPSHRLLPALPPPLPFPLHLKPPSPPPLPISSSKTLSKPEPKPLTKPQPKSIPQPLPTYRRAATGYAAALADASLRAGTLRAASLHAQSLIRLVSAHSDVSAAVVSAAEGSHFDARLVALVKMLVRKGKAGLIPEVMAEFGRICDELIGTPMAGARARHVYAAPVRF